jgi:3-hydroxyisobutyrate dehydrogenase-like beta-hydroxyacid dehydrogenase
MPINQNENLKREQMAKPTIGLMSPGDMGHTIGGVFVGKGHRVVTVLSGRSDLSKARAERAGMEDVADLNALVAESDFIFSIMPPEKADAFAGEVATAMKESGEKAVYVDCNAISPDTTLSIAAKMADAGATMVNVGIIGPPPGKLPVSRNAESSPPKTKFYASGPDVDLIRFVDGDGIKFMPMGDDITKASAIKMCYAALTKGMMTLHTSVLVTAELLGISEEIQSEIENSQKFHWEGMNKRVSMYACDAGRWAGEMDQISDTFGSAGMTPNLHKGAADVFRVLDASPLGAETRETHDKSRSMQSSIEIYAKTARELKDSKKAAE